MKKNGLFAILLYVLSIMCFDTAQSQKKLDDLFMNNVEALATGEDEVPVHCYGSGSVDCPSGAKVKFVISGFGLDTQCW